METYLPSSLTVQATILARQRDIAGGHAVDDHCKIAQTKGVMALRHLPPTAQTISQSGVVASMIIEHRTHTRNAA